MLEFPVDHPATEAISAWQAVMAWPDTNSKHDVQGSSPDSPRFSGQSDTATQEPNKIKFRLVGRSEKTVASRLLLCAKTLRRQMRILGMGLSRWKASRHLAQSSRDSQSMVFGSVRRGVASADGYVTRRNSMSYVVGCVSAFDTPVRKCPSFQTDRSVGLAVLVAVPPQPHSIHTPCGSKPKRFDPTMPFRASCRITHPWTLWHPLALHRKGGFSYCCVVKFLAVGFTAVSRSAGLYAGVFFLHASVHT